MDNMEEILSVEGLEIVSIGWLDLALWLGGVGDEKAEALVTKYRQKLLDLCKDKGIAGILVAITWIIIILTLIMRFIKKLRRDELEFKRALWIGMGLGLGGMTSTSVRNRALVAGD